jgi:hypothetical protein
VVNGVEKTHLLTHQFTAPTTGNIIEDVCVVPMDPRVAQFGSCTAAATAPKSPYANGLSVAQVCGAGFDNPHNPLFVPNSMCGGSNGSGFALVRTLTQAYSVPGFFPYNGTYDESDSNFSGLPPAPATDPACAAPTGNQPFGVLGWAPLAGEGKNPGGHSLLDLSNGCDQHAGVGTTSLWAIGLGLNTGAIPGGLVGFATTQYTNLLSTLADEDSTGEGALTPPSPPAVTPPLGNFTFQLQQCIQTSQGAFLNGSANYKNAALALLTADYSVFINATSSPPFTPSADYPNPSGLLRGLLESTRFTVAVRLDGEDPTPPALSPPPAPPPPSSPLPTITGNPNASIKVGQHYTFSPTTADFAGNTATLTYSLTGLPWATLSPAKKNNQVQVTGTAPAVPGNFPSVVLTVSDGCTTAQKTWSVTVTP